MRLVLKKGLISQNFPSFSGEGNRKGSGFDTGGVASNDLI